ncbi:PAS domain-containing sensor histidine kinase [Flammeovirga pacifica]|uniref:PAC domain-containing protein n=1 Tax=Flammeovirga pacifica TaxID=915059 RepID=A0A1S1Z0F1_FLAPC|nr:histidine kinase [Flammeovirga pacifica]OHX66740.1 hypothetical protein NH26_10410 [Flammeovirga pacifica]
MIRVRTAFTLLFSVIIIALIITTSVFLKLLDNRKSFGRMQFIKYSKLQISQQIEERNNKLSFLYSQYLIHRDSSWIHQYKIVQKTPYISSVDYHKYAIKDTVFNWMPEEKELLHQAQIHTQNMRKIEAKWMNKPLPQLSSDSLKTINKGYIVHKKKLYATLKSFDQFVEINSIEKWNISLKEGLFYFYLSLGLLLSVLLFSILSFILILRRVRKQEKLDLELEKSDERFQLAIKGTKSIIWDFNAHNKTLKWLPKGKSFLKFPFDTIGNDIEFIKKQIHKDDLQLLEEVIQQQKETRGHIAFDARFYDKEGELRWLRCQGLPVFDPTSTLLKRIVGTFTDITDRLKQDEKVVNAVLETEDKERSRIARDIHDSLQQTMGTALLHFEKVRLHLPSLEPTIDNHFQQGYSLLKKSIQESRSLAHNLMPKVVEENGVVPAIQSLVTALQGSTSTKIAFFENLGEDRLKLSTEISLYRIVQESINNMIKHAKAEKCTIQLLKYPDMIVLTIEDDGIGFETSVTENSFGLNSLKTRASAIGAYLQVSSTVNKGTEIFLELGL